MTPTPLPPTANPAREPEAPQPTPRTIDIHLGRTLATALTILAVAAVAFVAWQLLARFASLLLIVVLALLVAFIFAPAVSALQRRSLPRVAAIALAYVGSLVVIGAVLTVFLGPLVAQLAALAGQLPHEIQTIQGHSGSIDAFFRRHGLPLHVATLQKQVLGQTQAIGAVLLGSTLTLLSGLTTFVVDLFLIVVLSFYILVDSAKIHDNLIRLVPARWRPRAFFVEAAFVKVVGGYIRGQLMMALTIGIAAGLGCAILGVHYPLVIGLLAGVFELMPMVGPVLGAIPAVVIALTQGPSLVLWVIVLFIVIQQLEAHVIGPRITGHAVGLHPLGAILALLAGVEVGGIVGALFAVPAAGILYVLAVAVYWQWQGQSVPPVPVRSSRLVGLARGVVRRRAAPPLVATPPPAPASGTVITAAAAVATAGGDSVPRPETLVNLERQADELHERFEQAETERRDEQRQSVAQATHTDG